jgi:hypothetical protein
MSVDAFMGDIELLPVAIKQLPDFIPVKILPSFFISIVFGNFH